MSTTLDSNLILKPCPFCGSEAEIVRMGTHRVSMEYACTDCGTTLETGETVLTEHCQWNKRYEPPLSDDDQQGGASAPVAAVSHLDKHTQGELKLGPHNSVLGGQGREHGSGMVQGQLFMACTQEWMQGGELEANAQRLVACWNACQGLATGDLEKLGLANALGNQLLEQERQLNELKIKHGQLLVSLVSNKGT